jgi:hypothetical protein
MQRKTNAAPARGAKAGQASAGGKRGRQDPPAGQPRAQRVIDVRVLENERRKLEFSVIISLVSLLLSAVAAGAAVYAYARNSNVEVQEPHMLYLYRDGPAGKGILKAALNVTMINTADAKYGDALMDARVRLGASPRQWTEEATASVSIAAAAPVVPPACPAGTRCVANGGFLAEERDFMPISLAGGGIETVTLVFPVTATRCHGDAAQCAKVGSFDVEVARQVTKRMSVTLDLQFLQDGSKTVVCELEGIDLQYLLTRGFVSRTCKPERGDG